jgi:uncharacterized protein YjbI with pentapeptide repeats
LAASLFGLTGVGYRLRLLIICLFSHRAIDFTPDVLYFRRMRHQWSMLLLLAVMTCSIAVGQCQAQPASATAATVDAATPAPTITDTPTVIDEATIAPTPTVAPSPTYPPLHIKIEGKDVTVFPVSGEQILQFQQWEKQNADATRRSTFAWWGFWGALLALVIAFSRSVSHAKQVREQMLTSFRERLFSKDPGAVIAAAMSLSAFPKEAIWLVMRFAEEHKREEFIKKNNAFANHDDPQQIKQAIQDAMSNMSKRYTWAWKLQFKKILKNKHRISTPKLGFSRLANVIFCKVFNFFRLFLLYPSFKIRGARLDGSTITIDIGPVNLCNAYMVGGNFSGIGLEGANLSSANLQHANLNFANLQHAYLDFANLPHVYLSSANLQHANLSSANLQHAYIMFANLQQADLSEANLQHAILWKANLNGVYLRKLELQGAKLEDDYLSCAQNMSAILDDEQKQKVMEWETNHPNAPWLNAIPYWRVYKFYIENKKRQIQNNWAKEMGEYIDKTRGKS